MLRFNQVLWYGTNLAMSLINPNQIRHGGFVLSNDPTDMTRRFGIVGDDFHIPFEIEGTTIYFQSQVPTRWEMENCRILEINFDAPWNPTEVLISAGRSLAPYCQTPSSIGESGVGVAETHNNSTKSGLSTGVGSNSEVGCAATQL